MPGLCVAASSASQNGPREKYVAVTQEAVGRVHHEHHPSLMNTDHGDVDGDLSDQRHGHQFRQAGRTGAARHLARHRSSCARRSVAVAAQRDICSSTQ